MARLPDDTVLGQLPSANSGRPIAQYDTSSIGAGLSNLGKGMSNAAWDIAKVQAKQQSDEDALDTAKAESQYLLDKVKLNKQVKDETDYNGLSEKYSPLYTQARDNAANLIRNPRAREQFLLKRTPDTQNSIFAVEDHAFSLQKDKEISGANDRLEELRNNALRADPAQRGQFIKAGNDLISGLVSSQYIDNTQAQKLRKAWTEKYAEGAISVLPAEEQINLLREAPKGKDAVLDRIGGIENATGDPAARSATSSAMGNFQFINSTWLDTVRKNRPDIANGRSDEDLLALRSDPKLSREMAGYLLNENESALKAQGIDATPGNLYLAHFLGAGAAVKVLKADKDTPVADIVGADAVKANQSVLGGKTVGSVVGWAERKMGGTARGAGGLIDFIPEQRRLEMLESAQASLVDSARQKELAAAQAKQQSDDTEASIFSRIHSDDASLSLQKDILQNPNLTLQAKQRMTSQFESRTKDKTEQLYGKGFWDAYERVHLPPGDPRKISDPSVLYPMAVKGGSLTPAGVDKLVQEIAGKRTPDGEAEGAVKKDFFTMARKQITGSNDYIKDPKGDEKYLQFHVAAEKAISQARKDGKSIISMFDEKSPDYLGKMIPQFKRPASQMLSDMVNNDGPKSPAEKGGFDPANVKSADELITAYQNGKIDRFNAQRIAVEKGWGVRKQPASQPVSDTPSVPMSQ